MSTSASVWRALCAAALLACTGPLAAASLQVSPTTLVVPPERNAQGLFLSNSGDKPLQAQVRVFRWRQVDGEDVLEPTGDLVASPPMLDIPAGGEQLVRIVRVVPAPARTEASYRVVVDELPLESANDTGPGLRFVLRYSIPVFLAPQSGPAAPVLHARVTGGAARFLELQNLGDARAQVSDLTHVAADGRRTVLAPGLSGYVLPGQSRRWSLDGVAGGAFAARINGEADARTLALDR